MLRSTVREPSNQAGSIHEKWANEPPFLCACGCGCEVAREGDHYSAQCIAEDNARRAADAFADEEE